MSSQQDQHQTTVSTPWAPQQAALTNAFTQAGNALTQAQGATAPTDYTAQFTPAQLATFQQMLGYANGNSLPGTQGTAGATNIGTGTAANSGALSGFQNFDPTSALSTPNVLSTAQAYMSGQDIPAQVRAAMQQGVETARDTTLPGIEQSAATSGNTDSSRTGVAQGIVQRGLAENAQNLTGALTNQAWNNAITSALSTGNSTNAATLQKLQDLGVLGSSASSAGNTGIDSSINNQGSLFNIGENAGQGQQAANQANLTNQLQQYQAGITDPFAPINNYMGIIGTNNWGGTSTTDGTTTTTPSALSVIGGLLGTAGQAAGMAGGLGWKPLGK
jgi:hypothetical protein